MAVCCLRGPAPPLSDSKCRVPTSFGCEFRELHQWAVTGARRVVWWHINAVLETSHPRYLAAVADF